MRVDPKKIEQWLKDMAGLPSDRRAEYISAMLAALTDSDAVVSTTHPAAMYYENHDARFNGKDAEYWYRRLQTAVMERRERNEYQGFDAQHWYDLYQQVVQDAVRKQDDKPGAEYWKAQYNALKSSTGAELARKQQLAEYWKTKCRETARAEVEARVLLDKIRALIPKEE